MGQSRGEKVKALHGRNVEGESVFWMSLEEAKLAIADKYEFLADRYDRRFSKAVVKQKHLPS